MIVITNKQTNIKLTQTNEQTSQQKQKKTNPCTTTKTKKIVLFANEKSANKKKEKTNLKQQKTKGTMQQTSINKDNSYNKSYTL